jgi:16S rRNA C1402 N4-methylase RsmH
MTQNKGNKDPNNQLQNRHKRNKALTRTNQPNRIPQNKELIKKNTKSLNRDIIKLKYESKLTTLLFSSNQNRIKQPNNQP